MVDRLSIRDISMGLHVSPRGYRAPSMSIASTAAPTALYNAVLNAVAHEGITATTRDGKPARLAVVDDYGNVLEVGDTVAAAAWRVVVECYENLLIGKGHIRVIAGPPVVDAEIGVETQKSRKAA